MQVEFEVCCGDRKWRVKNIEKENTNGANIREIFYLVVWAFFIVTKAQFAGYGRIIICGSRTQRPLDLSHSSMAHHFSHHRSKSAPAHMLRSHDAPSTGWCCNKRTCFLCLLLVLLVVAYCYRAEISKAMGIKVV